MRVTPEEINAIKERAAAARARLDRIRARWSADEAVPPGARRRLRPAEAIAIAEELQREADVAFAALTAQQEQLACALDRLRNERRGSHELFEYAPDPSIVTDGGGLILEANAAARELLGAEATALRGRPITSLTLEADQALVRSTLQGLPRVQAIVALHTGNRSAVRVHLRGTRVDADRVAWVLTRSMAFHSGVFQRPDAEVDAERPPATVDAEHRLAVLSKELRDPLFALLGWTRVLRETRLSPDRRQRAVDAIERSALQQAALVEGLLGIARLQHARLSIESGMIDLGKIVARISDALRPAAAAKGVVLEVRAEPRVVLQGDELRLSQVVMNLLTNAIKFTPKGGTVTASVNADGDEATLTVADTGRGIRADLLDTIFGCFVQASPDDARAGVGLGLFIVKELVELHGGRISVESDGEGRGARFTVSLRREANRVAPSANVG